MYVTRAGGSTYARVMLMFDSFMHSQRTVINQNLVMCLIDYIFALRCRVWWD